MFKALLRRIIEAVRGAIENQQERTDLSIRIPVGYLVACRRVHGQRSRRPKMRRGRGKNTEVALAKQLTGIKSRNEQIKEENDELKRELEVCRDKIKELEDKIIGLEEKDRGNSNEISRLNSINKMLEQKVAFPHLRFGPRAARDYAKLGGKDLQTVVSELKKLDDSAIEWYVKGGPKPSWKCEVNDESATVKEGKWREKRRFKSYLGTTKLFMLHAYYLGKKKRIYLRIDPRKREVEIGYIGKKLPTARFPTV